MSRRGWILFSSQAFIWGVPYLLIAIAVESLAPPTVVAGRTGFAALLLLPVAIHRGALRPALARWRGVLAFAAIEMAGPFLLLSHAEQTLPSGMTGLLVATVPLFGALVGFLLGDRSAVGPRRLLGLGIGFAGVALVVGGSVGSTNGSITPTNVAEVLLVAVCYATAPFIAHRHLDEVPGIGMATVALGAVAAFYLPIAVVAQDGAPTARSLWALAGLTVLCTAIAFITFFALIAEVGPAKATMFTYLNPVVALGLGVVVLDERLTWGLVAGFPVVLAGCWLAASHRDEDPVLVAEP